jgi:L-lactate dehydrogenase complex protein LldG
VNEVRDRILAGIRSSLRRGRLDSATEEKLRARLAAHRRNPVPARAVSLGHAEQVDLFVAMAEEVQATVVRVTSLADVPETVTRYLAAENLPAEIVMAPEPDLDAIPWELRSLLRIRRGRADGDDKVSVTPCHAAIAETGTLMLISGANTPTTLNFLPDTHIVVVHRNQVVATYEDGWDLLRAGKAPGDLPRAINFITGPSRTADIEQHIELGAHGPRRLHIVLVEDTEATRSAENDGQSSTPLRGRVAPIPSGPAAAPMLKQPEQDGSSRSLPPPALDRFAGIDRANAERLKRGLHRIEARLDLHGMTQAEAHQALAAFIGAARDAGRRCVLVITGRGFGSSGSGVLKSSVPRWLEQPELRRQILAIAPAQPHHGGAGATYLLLRRRR